MLGEMNREKKMKRLNISLFSISQCFLNLHSYSLLKNIIYINTEEGVYFLSIVYRLQDLCKIISMLFINNIHLSTILLMADTYEINFCRICHPLTWRQRRWPKRPGEANVSQDSNALRSFYLISTWLLMDGNVGLHRAIFCYLLSYLEILATRASTTR